MISESESVLSVALETHLNISRYHYLGSPKMEVRCCLSATLMAYRENT